MLSQEISLRQSKIQLNQILARPAATEFDVDDSIPLAGELPLANWKNSLSENNSSILQANAQRNVLADQASQHFVHGSDELVQAQYLRLQHLLAAECHQLPRQRYRALGRALHLSQVLGSLRIVRV